MSSMRKRMHESGCITDGRSRVLASVISVSEGEPGGSQDGLDGQRTRTHRPMTLVEKHHTDIS